MENVVVDIVVDSVKSILHRLNNQKNPYDNISPSIYKVPSYLRNLSPTSFNPRVVSIGPLHRKDGNLKEFEEHKESFVHHVLNRFRTRTPPEQTLEACLRRVHASIDRVRACYLGMEAYTDAQLAEMMAIDGCFIVGFLCNLSDGNHVVYKNMIVRECIVIDLVLLENQIPFFVLQDIFDCINLKPTQGKTLTTLVLDSFELLIPFKVPPTNVVNDTTDHDHILGLLHKYFHPKEIMPQTDEHPGPIAHHSALELDKAGVNFKPHEDEKWKMAIEFKSSWFACFCWSWGKPTLRLPVLRIDDFTELFLRNLIAYEQCTPHVCYYVTSFVVAMDMLVDTPEDITKLIESNVLINHLVSNEGAANMINNVSKNIIVGEFFYMKQWKEMDSYYNGYWPRNIARLRRTYFTNPWTIIALLAAIALFALTIIQTIFTVKSAKNNK